MKKNIGAEDAFMRLLVGITFIVIFLVEQYDSSWSIFWVLLGFLNMANSILRYSLLYKLLKIDTNKKKTA
jgi:drug/metabolite transporter (DMT)-like permease